MKASLCSLVITEKELADDLGRAPSTIRARGRAGNLPPFCSWGRHKYLIVPVVDAWLESDFDANTKIVVDISPYPTLLRARELAAVLRIGPPRIYDLITSQPDCLPPRRGKEWTTKDMVSWLAAGAGIADRIVIETRPISVAPQVLEAHSGLVAITQQLQQSHRSSGRGR